MKRLLVIIVVLLTAGPYVQATSPDAEEDIAQGWTAAQNAAWMDMQIKFSQAIKQHGADSPEATEAQVLMNTLARRLGIKAPSEKPEFAPLAPPPEEQPPVEETNEEAHAPSENTAVPQ